MPKGTTTIHFDLDVPDEVLVAWLLRYQMSLHPPLKQAMAEADFDRGLLDPADPLRVGGEQTPAPPPSALPPAASPSVPEEGEGGKPVAAAEDPAPSTKPLVRTKGRKVNGDGQEQPRQPLAEPMMRALLSSVSDVHPQRVAGVIAILAEHGGSKRLMDCPSTTWPAIEDAANAALQQYRPAVG
jgi:hypothetical protein